MRRNQQRVAILAGVLAILSVSAGVSRAPTPEVLRGLANGDPEIRQRTEKNIKEQRESIADGLLSLAMQPENNPETRDRAITLLGEYRVDQQRCTSFLVDNITRKGHMMIYTAWSPLNGYPCALALAKTGHAATHEIFGRLVHERTDKELELYTYVVLCADGDDVAITRFRLQTGIKESDGLRKRNLEKMLGFLPKD